jgi:Domain of unknown function (DUF4440)
MELADKQMEYEIEKLELAEAAATLRNDLDLIEKLWSDKLVVSGAANLLFSKSQLLAFFRAGLIRIKSFERRVTRVVVDRDVAIATGSDAVTPLVGPDMGKTVFVTYLNCWSRENGAWKMLGRHATVVGRMKADGTFETAGN